MLTRESLGLIFDELDKSDKIVAVFSGLVPPYPIGSIYTRDFKDRLIFLVDLGCRDTFVCAMVALDGSRECLKYAHEHGCPWDIWTCAYAAYSRSLECLEYAHTHGCPWNTYTCSNAAVSGSLKCLEYAHIHGCP